MCCRALWGYHLFTRSALRSHGNQYSEEPRDNQTMSFLFSPLVCACPLHPSLSAWFLLLALLTCRLRRGHHAGPLCDVLILLPPCAQAWYSAGALEVWHAACHLWLSVAVQSKSAALQMDNESNVPDLPIPEGVFIASIDDRGVEALRPPHCLCFSIPSLFLSFVLGTLDSCSPSHQTFWLLFSAY